MCMTLINQRGRFVLIALSAVLLPGVITAQSLTGNVEFDVASVKPSKSNDLPLNSSFLTWALETPTRPHRRPFYRGVKFSTRHISSLSLI